MRFEPLPLSGCLPRGARTAPTTERGFLSRGRGVVKSFAAQGLCTDWVQSSVSFNAQAGTLRGLHYQKNPPEIKLLRCTMGTIFDVIVDLRPGSATWGQWLGLELSAQKPPAALCSRELCARLSNARPTASEVHYQMSAFYQPEEARGRALERSAARYSLALRGGPRLVSQRDALFTPAGLMKRVLVTGASGFLGRHCLHACWPIAPRRCMAQGVRGDRLPAEGACAFDLLDSVQTQENVGRVCGRRICFTWPGSPTPGRVLDGARKNARWLGASMHLLECFARCGGQRAVVAGSCAEYEWCHNRVPGARNPDNGPATLYGACKNALRAAAESLLPRHRRVVGLGTAVFSCTEPHERPGRLVPSVIDALLRGVPTDCTGGQQRRDFVHVQDAAQAIGGVCWRVQLKAPSTLARGAATTVAEVVGFPWPNRRPAGPGAAGHAAHAAGRAALHRGRLPAASGRSQLAARAGH